MIDFNKPIPEEIIKIENERIEKQMNAAIVQLTKNFIESNKRWINKYEETFQKQLLEIRRKMITDEQRKEEIINAISVHILHDAEIKIEWIEEYNEIIRRKKKG